MLCQNFMSVRIRRSRGVRGGESVRERRRNRSRGWTHQSLGFLDVFMSEKKLSIEVTEIDSIEIDDVNFAEASQDEVFEKFAADAAGADKENTRLFG